jgi:hypothetical protein
MGHLTIVVVDDYSRLTLLNVPPGALSSTLKYFCVYPHERIHVGGIEWFLLHRNIVALLLM